MSTKLSAQSAERNWRSPEGATHAEAAVSPSVNRSLKFKKLIKFVIIGKA